MKRYESTKQLTIEEFKTPFQTSLLSDNRWVKLDKAFPGISLHPFIYP